jgi:hypothetical protein
MCSLMNAPMRIAPLSSIFGATSTSTSPRATVSSWVPMATIDAMPPSDAPTSTGGSGSAVAIA